MASLVKSIDRNHLLSLGTIGSGQCGATGDEYKELHSVPGIDLCEYHDYQSGALPGDEWNGLATRVRPVPSARQAAVRGRAWDRDARRRGTARSRRDAWRASSRAQFAAGVVGVLAWNWRDEPHGGSSRSGYEIGPDDPALDGARRLLKARVSGRLTGGRRSPAGSWAGCTSRGNGVARGDRARLPDRL